MCGALRAHQRITTDTSPPCICAILGALRAHQRITTQLQSITGNWSTRCAPCAPTNYNVLGHNDNHLGARCASCAPTNYNSQGLGFGGRSPGCAPYAPTNYNGYQPTVTDLLGRVRLVRTNELQHHACHPAQKQSGCAPCAPTNYNLTQNVTMTRPDGAPHTHQRITTAM